MTRMADMLFQGAVIGFAIAAPVGPVGLLCIRRTLAYGPGSGVASGMGAAAAHALYGLLAALSLGTLTVLLVEHAPTLRVTGGLLLACLGAGALRRAYASARASAVVNRLGQRRLITAFASTFVLALTNPMTILFFTGVVAALTGSAAEPTVGATLAAGVFAGSTTWWLLLVGGVAAARRVLPKTALRWIEGGSGAVLLGFGVYAMLAGLRTL
jgi:threonine/homoserine/homoserine lactone efflux protein